MKQYAVTVQVHGTETYYIHADSPEQADQLVRDRPWDCEQSPLDAVEMGETLSVEEL